MLTFAEENECLTHTAPCGSNAKCTDTIGSFLCTCLDGYQGNGIVCTNINECESLHKCAVQQSNCTDTIGSYTCACLDSYYGDGVTCNRCNSIQNCSVPVICRDSLSSTCPSCDPGHYLRENGKFCESTYPFE